jgi:hypothetical protein
LGHTLRNQALWFPTRPLVIRIRITRAKLREVGCGESRKKKGHSTERKGFE